MRFSQDMSKRKIYSAHYKHSIHFKEKGKEKNNCK